MNKTLVIIKHDFINHVKSKGFIILTLIFPVIGFGAIGIYQLAQIDSGAPASVDIPRIGYVDDVCEFDYHSSESGYITFVPYETHDEATNALLANDIDEYFVINSDYIENGQITRYHREKELEMSGEVYGAIRAFLQDNLLQGQTSLEVIERVKNPLSVYSIRLDESGRIAKDQGGGADFLIPLVFGFLLIMAIGSSSGTLLQGLGEEKQNRIMEILLSSVSTRQLLIGKILGLGSAGLLQIIIWILSALLMVQLASTTIGGFFASMQIPGSIFVLGIVYFILGYLLFSVLSAGIGAIAANPKDTPQITILLMMTSILPFYIAMFFLRDNPDHVIGTILTIFPVTAPMSVFIRLGMSEIATWELALSICVLALSIVGSVLLAAKTFRVFLLMYGKTPKLGEIIHLIRKA